MTIAQHLATIDRLCAEEFPTGHGGSAPGSYGAPGGPGFHVVELKRSTGSPIGPDGVGEEAEQYEAEREALAQRLGDRWGEPHWMSFDGVFLRAQQGDEHIPEPWASLGSHMRNAQVWRRDDTGRWLVLGISRLGEDQELRLLAVITDIDPP
ncbi:hypothetical protein ACFV06_08970 [Streptomyces sp. NPDC059618]|uniref:hypothetical protein n=1 Tax=Streptomyces sp. NPDC059618 TaxID=3346887 RepID=UPI0036C446E6